MKIKEVGLSKKVSSSKLEGMNNCGYKYLFKEELKLSSKSNASLNKGIAFKKALSKLNTSRQNGDIISLDSLKDFIFNKIDKNLYRTEMEYLQVVNDVNRELERYYNWYITKQYEVLEVDYQGSVFYQEESGTVEKLSIKIDVILKDSRGNIIGVIYKSGKPNLSYKRIPKSLARAGKNSVVKDIRLGISSMLLTSLYSCDNITVQYHHMKNKEDRFESFVTAYNDGEDYLEHGSHGDNIVSFSHTSESIPVVKDIIDENLRKIKEGEIEIKESTFNCKDFCEYYSVCPQFIKKEKDTEKESNIPVENKRVIEKEKKKEIVFNDKQKESINYEPKALMIIAPPGSGKTATITERAHQLVLRYGANPEEVLLITFTNKAANELRERVSREKNGLKLTKKFVVETYNGFGFRVIQEQYEKLGFEKVPTIASVLEKMHIIHENIDVFKINGLNYLKIKDILQNIYSFTVMAKKKEWLDKNFDDICDEVLDYYQEDVDKKELYRSLMKATKAIQEQMYSKNLIDYEDQIFLTNKLFKENPDVLNEYQDRYKHILVDEYQDSDNAQDTMICTLAQKNRSITVIGDEDQSIYGFRGANIQNIIDFDKSFPELKKIYLEDNYRSKGDIISVSTRLIENNTTRFNKTAKATRDNEADVLVVQAASFEDEVKFVIDKIKNSIEEGFSYSDFAIISRTNTNMDIVKNALIDENIPVSFTRSSNIFDRDNIKKVITMLKIVEDPSDDILAISMLQQYDISLREALILTRNKPEQLSIFDYITFGQIIPELKKSLKKERHLLECYEKFLDDYNKIDVYSQDDVILKFVEILNLYNPNKDSEKFKEAVSNFIYLGNEEADATFEKIIDFINLSDFYKNEIDAEEDNLKESNAVKIITSHSSKGLEFSNVFMIKCNDYIKKNKTSEEKEEARRLFFVSMTRAKDNLYMSWYDNRDKKRENSTPLFIKEIEDLNIVKKELV